MRFEADPDLRRTEDGTVAIGGSPLRILRLSSRGADALDRLTGREPIDLDDEQRAFAFRLVDLGFLVPRYSVDRTAEGGPDVSVVVPTFGRPAELDGCLRALAKSPCGQVIVVDDGSPDPSAVAAVAEHHGATVVQCDERRGPAAARNAGLAFVDTPLVAFVDSDVEVGTDWLPWLLCHLSDPDVAVVAPRVVCPAPELGANLVAQYERYRSPLDMGARPGPVRPGSRVSYVPGAALLCRRDAILDVGGFDETLLVGEDVDLLWRIVESGHRCWYVGDDSWVEHPPRPSAPAWLAQRFAYGSAAAALDERHPGAAAPLGVSGWSAAAWAAAATGHPFIAAAVTASTVVALTRKLDFLDEPLAESIRLGGVGHVRAGESIGRALLRPWMPLTLAASLVSRRARRMALTAAIVTPLLERRRLGATLEPASWIAMSLADDAAYSAGVWASAWREKRWGALIPAFKNWPGRPAEASVPAPPT